MTNKQEAPARQNRRSIKSILLLPLLGALVGATAGFLLAGTPNYKSTGMIQIKPIIPGVFAESPIVPRFDDYADAQVEIMKSRRTIDMAMQNLEWKAFGRGLSDKAVADFQSSLSAARNGIIVTVSFLDPDPAASRMAVSSVIKAYQSIYDDANTGDENRRSDILENLKNKYQSDLKRLRDSLRQDSGLDPEAVDITYKFKLDELNRIESELQQLEVELHIITATTQAAAAHPSTTLPAQPPIDDNNVTALRLRTRALTDQISQCKANLRNLSNEKMQLDDLKAQETTALRNLEAVKSRIQQLNVESQIGGRISIISDGTTPLSPDYAPRKKDTLLGLLLGTSLASIISLFITPRTQPKKPSSPLPRNPDAPRPASSAQPPQTSPTESQHSPAPTPPPGSTSK